MRAGRWAVVAAVAAAAAVAVPGSALAGPPGPPGSDVQVVEPPLIRPGATYPVEDVMFPTATLDGAVIEGGGTVRMSADLMFDFDSSVLTARAREEIARLVPMLRAAGSTRIDVVGHTDDRGADGYNLGLSQGRAAAVRDELAAALGPPVVVTANGRGEAEPVADNATEAGRALNRRVQITYA